MTKKDIGRTQRTNQTKLNNQSKPTNKQSLAEKRPFKRLASVVRKTTLGCEEAALQIFSSWSAIQQLCDGEGDGRSWRL